MAMNASSATLTPSESANDPTVAVVTFQIPSAEEVKNSLLSNRYYCRPHFFFFMIF
jgi:hypothetical protein